MSYGLCANHGHSRRSSVTTTVALRRCAHCRRRFTPRRTTARYCGSGCRVAAWRRRQEALAKAPPRHVS